MAIRVTITNVGTRAAVDNAITALQAVHALPAGAPDIDVVERSPLPHGYAAMFTPRTDGTFEIAIDPNRSELHGVDFLHEFGHFVDWAILDPPGGMTSGTMRAEIAPWADAVVQSEAYAELERIRDAPRGIQVTLADGTVAHVAEEPGLAQYFLQPWELFANSYCQYVIERCGDPELGVELVEALRNHYPQQWESDEFEPIGLALEQLLGGNP